MNYRIILGFIFSLMIVSTVIGAFPLKQMKKGDAVPLEKFEGINKNVSEMDDSDVKILLLWRNDKRTSVNTAEDFVKMCSERKVPCISIDLQNGSMEKIRNIVGKSSDNIYFARDKESITDSWGIFTLPVTVFLDKDNKIINAVGFEGQYEVKVGRYVDYLTGKISEEKYNELENTSSVDRSRSKLPKINFIKRLITDGQPEDAKEHLKKLDKSDLKMEEKLNLAEVYLKLNMPEKAENALKGISEYNVGGKFYRAYAVYLKGDMDKSLEMLHSIEKIYPQKKTLYYLLGEIYKKKGDYKNAAEYFEKSCNNSAL